MSVVWDSVSRSRLLISRSNVDFNSLDARRNSVMAFPSVLPSSGSFFGPKMSSARTKMKTISCIPRGPILSCTPPRNIYEYIIAHLWDMPGGLLPEVLDQHQVCAVLVGLGPQDV